MKFNFFGNPQQEKILFLHAALTNYNLYIDTINELSKKFYLIVPELPGHDSENKTEFISLEKHAQEIEEYLIKNGHEQLHGIYGFCMGGAFTVKIIDNGKIKFKKILLEASMTPYQLPKIIRKLILLRDYYGILYYRKSLKNFKKLFKGRIWSEEVMREIFDFSKHTSKENIKSIFWSVNNYTVENNQCKNIDNIEYWYGGLEEKERAWDMAWIKKYFPGIKFRVFEGMDHGESVIMDGTNYAEEIGAFFV